MSQQQPPGWHPGGYPQQQGQPYPSQAPQGHPYPQGQPYPPPGAPQPPRGGSGRLIVGIVIGIVAVFGIIVAGLFGLALYVRSQRAAEAEGDRKAIRDRQADDAREQQRAQIEAARVEAEKRQVRTGKYLEVSDLAYYDKGWINDYRQLIGLTVVNRSKYPVHNLAGNVEWVDGNGAVTGSVPFTLGGSLLPGDTKRYTQADGTLRNGTLQSSAKRARIVFTRVDIVE